MAERIQLEIRRPNGTSKTFDIEAGIYTIGRDDDCRLHLPHADVEPRHAILTVGPDGAWIEDLDTDSGTSINGLRVAGHMALPFETTLLIGPFMLTLQQHHAIFLF